LAEQPGLIDGEVAANGQALLPLDPMPAHDSPGDKVTAAP
jgi:hypothetical protein